MEIIKLAGLDEEIYYAVSNKGLPIYVWKNEYAKSFYMSLNVFYGSLHTEFMINEKKYCVPDGIAHFMEHIKFNVDKDRTANDLFDPLGSDINAFTTFRYTSYLVYGNSLVKDNLNNLLDYVLNPYFTKEMIKKERGIIASEINMTKDMPYNNLYFKFNKNMFHNKKYRNLISGEVEDIKKIDLDDIKLIYEAFYHPNNMALIVTGNVNPYDILQIVNDNLEAKDIKKYLNPVIIEEKEPKTVYKKEEIVASNVEVLKAKIGYKIPRKNFKELDDITLNIILNIILGVNFDDTSDLKEQLLLNNIITYMGTNRYVMDDYVVLVVTIESKILDEAIKWVKNAFNKLTITKEELERKINAAVANLVTNYEDVEQVNNYLQDNLVYYQKIIPNVKEIYENIDLAKVNYVLNNINLKEMCVVKMIAKK